MCIILSTYKFVEWCKWRVCSHVLCSKSIFDLPLCVCVAGVIVDEIVWFVYYETHIELHMWLRPQINIQIKVLICDPRKV